MRRLLQTESACPGVIFGSEGAPRGPEGAQGGCEGWAARGGGGRPELILALRIVYHTSC